MSGCCLRSPFSARCLVLQWIHVQWVNSRIFHVNVDLGSEVKSACLCTWKSGHVTSPSSWQLVVPWLVCLRSTGLLGEDYTKMSVHPAFLTRQWIHASASVYESSGLHFTPFLREGGPQILRSILGDFHVPFASRSLPGVLVAQGIRDVEFKGRWLWENVFLERSWFDSGYTPLRQSADLSHLAVTFRCLPRLGSSGNCMWEMISRQCSRTQRSA